MGILAFYAVHPSLVKTLDAASPGSAVATSVSRDKPRQIDMRAIIVGRTPYF
jgi:hypothetical protein